MSQEIWYQPAVVEWTGLLLDSYEQLLKQPLIERKGTKEQQAYALFFAPFVIVSHGKQEDPIFNYANQKALELWEMSWEDFTQMPSRLSAEEVYREERKEFLQQAAKQDFSELFKFIRITSKGRRFLIDRAIVWNVYDPEHQYCGQAAHYKDWIFLD
jgi:hypothetical protein